MKILQFRAVPSVATTLLDGRYRHDGVTLAWDSDGIVLARSSTHTAVQAGWHEVYGARHIGGQPGFVQVLIFDHLPLPDPRFDPFTVPVSSEADANRLVTSIQWRVTPVSGSRTSWLRRRRQRA